MQKSKKEQNLFTSDNIGIRCPRNKEWNKMEEVKNGRFCDGCHEKLFYVGGYTKSEVMALQRKYGTNICVGIRETSNLALEFSTHACSVSKSNCNTNETNLPNIENYDIPIVVGIPIFDNLKDEEEKSIVLKKLQEAKDGNIKS